MWDDTQDSKAFARNVLSCSAAEGVQLQVLVCSHAQGVQSDPEFRLQHRRRRGGQHVLGEVGSYGKQMNRVLERTGFARGPRLSDAGETDHHPGIPERATSGVTMADLDPLMDEIANLERRNPAATPRSSNGRG